MKFLLLGFFVISLSSCTNNTSSFKEDVPDLIVSISEQGLDDIPSSLSFGQTNLSIRSLQKSILIVNSDSPLLLGDISIQGVGFKIKINRCPSTLAPRKSCSITLDFSQKGLFNGSYNGSLSIGAISVQLNGGVDEYPDPETSGTPILVLTMDSFFEQFNGKSSRILNIKNQGTGRAKNISFQIPTGYVLKLNRCPSSLNPNDSCSVEISLVDFRKNPIPTIASSIAVITDGVTIPSSISTFSPLVCTSLQHESEGLCVSNTASCHVDEGTGEKYWDSLTSQYGLCEVVSCNTTFHESANTCQPNTQSCFISNFGVGFQIYNPVTQHFDPCQVDSCNPGYHESGNTCVVDVPVNFSLISSGNSHSCALDDQGKAYCWGQDPNGQLGVGIVVNSFSTAQPVVTSGVLSDKILTNLSAGVASTCALDTLGRAYCWGAGNAGQLGNGINSNSLVPQVVSVTGVLSGRVLTEISTGSHSCALDMSGRAFCWGPNSSGQLGNGLNSTMNVPQAVNVAGALFEKVLVKISAGMNHTCALDVAGKAYCWGAGVVGQIGNGLNTSFNTPQAVYTGGVLLGKSLVEISNGPNNTCALDDQGKAYCWGRGLAGEMGNGSNSHSFVPVAVSTSGVLVDKFLVKIAVGSQYTTCALDILGFAYCWGNNDYGQLGNSSYTSSNVPVAVNTVGVLSGKILSNISVGAFFACSLDSTGKAYCWGDGSNGKLGTGSVTSSNVPVSTSIVYK